MIETASELRPVDSPARLSVSDMQRPLRFSRFAIFMASYQNN